MEAQAVTRVEGSTEALYGLASRFHRGRRARHVSMGVLQEPGRSCRLHRRVPGRGGRVTNRSRPEGGALLASGANGSAAVEPASEGERSEPGKAAGSQSIPVVPVKSGNSSRGDPVEGSGMPG